MKVSIVTITHNRAHLIAETIQSVLDQTYKDFEHLIIDDGSTDDTKTIVGNFADHRIKYHKYERIANLSRLHNIGIARACGDLIAILDSDDIWASNKLEDVVKIFQSDPKVEFLTHNIQYFCTEKPRSTPYYSYKSDFFEHAIDDVLRFRILPFPVSVFRKSITDKIGVLDENMVDGQQDFLMRIATKCKIYFMASNLTYMRIHDQNIHKANNLPYFLNYYKSITRLLLSHDIRFVQFMIGWLTNSKSLTRHVLKY